MVSGEREGCDTLTCDRGAECKETVNGAHCVCIAGFIWNGESCIPNPEGNFIEWSRAECMSKFWWQDLGGSKVLYIKKYIYY